jgi:hypothetical protein
MIRLILNQTHLFSINEQTHTRNVTKRDAVCVSHPLVELPGPTRFLCVQYGKYGNWLFQPISLLN